MFLTQGLDQFLVGRLIAVFSQDTKQSLSLVQSFGGFVETTGKSVLDQGGLEHFTESCFEVHATSRSSVAPPAAAAAAAAAAIGSSPSTSDM